MIWQAESGGMVKGRRAKLLGKAAFVAGALIAFGLGCGAANAQQKIVKLKWVFDEDPRPLIPETKKNLQVIKFLVVKVYIHYAIAWKEFYLTVKLETKNDCVKAKQGEVLFFLELPSDYLSASKHQGYWRLYDTKSADSIESNREYFGLLDCNKSDQLSYIEESSRIIE